MPQKIIKIIASPWKVLFYTKILWMLKVLSLKKLTMVLLQLKPKNMVTIVKPWFYYTNHGICSKECYKYPKKHGFTTL